MLETQSASEAVSLVSREGVAIWRGLLAPEIVQQVIAPAAESLQHQDAYVSLKYAVLKLGILPAQLQARLFPLHISAVFDAAIPDYEFPIRELYLTHKGFYMPHAWHQDANATNQRYHFMCWIAATHCGENSPGLSFAVGNPGRYIGGDIDDWVTGARIISPVMAPGDAVFFDSFSIHKTNITPEMTLDRVAIKFGVTAPLK